jgi:hypothetical protein
MVLSSRSASRFDPITSVFISRVSYKECLQRSLPSLQTFSTLDSFLYPEGYEQQYFHHPTNSDVSHSRRPSLLLFSRGILQNFEDNPTLRESWKAVFLLIQMVEQERRRVRSLENVLGTTQAHIARPEAQRIRSRSMNHDALSEDALETAASVPLPPSPSEQQVNGIAHEQPQRLPAVVDNRDRLSADNSPENIATPEDTFFAQVEEARQQLLCRRNPNGYSTVRAALNSKPRTSSLNGDTRAPLTNGYTSSSSLTNGDTNTLLTNGYHHPAPIINGDPYTTTNGHIASSQQQTSTTPNSVNPSPNPPPTTTTRIQMNELVGVLVRVLRDTEPRPSETQIQIIATEYIRHLSELRESNQRQFEDLGEEVHGLNTTRPMVNSNSAAVNSFHIDAGIVRNENSVNGIIPHRSTPTPENATDQLNFMRRRARRFDITNEYVNSLLSDLRSRGRHSTEPNPASTNTATQQEALGRWYDNDESLDYHPHRATGSGLLSSPTNFRETANGVNEGTSRPTYATVAALANGQDLEATGSGNWIRIAQLSSPNRAWDPNATQAIGRDVTNLTADRRFVKDTDLVNDTDLSELRAFRNEDAHPHSIYHITPPGTPCPPLSTRSNSLSGTTLVNSIPSLSGSTHVNSSVGGDTPPPSMYGGEHIGIELYRNGTYETALRRRRAMSDIRGAARSAGIPIDEHERRGAVAVGYIGLRERDLRPYPNSASDEEEENETLREAEESWWGLRDGRAARRRDSVEEEMLAHVLGREQHVAGNERLDAEVDAEVPRDGDYGAEHEAGDEQGRVKRTGRE